MPAHVKIDHESNWTIGSHEDGYIRGLDNLIDVFKILLCILKIV